MSIRFQVYCPTCLDTRKVDKIATDLGFRTTGSTLSKEHRVIECLSHDDSQALREIYRELGYQTQKVYS